MIHLVVAMILQASFKILALVLGILRRWRLRRLLAPMSANAPEQPPATTARLTVSFVLPAEMTMVKSRSVSRPIIYRVIVISLQKTL